MSQKQRFNKSWPWIAGLCALSLLIFGGVLFGGGTRVLGNANTDLFLHFLSSRAFGFREMQTGHLPLWNPHIYGGAPYLGSMQPALLYPPNIIFLFLSTEHAINWCIALHVCLLGGFVFAWAKYRGMQPAAAFLSAGLAMFGGAHFLHIYAGHLSNVCTMAWAPLVFLAIDGIFANMAADRRNGVVGWCLAGVTAVAMQIFAGHPQYLFYTAVAAGIYALLRLPGSPRFIPTSLALLVIYPGGAMLGAAQLFAGMEASKESIRSGTTFEFASMFSFPPENLLTLVTPNLFGDMTHQIYWGRCYLWEMSLFLGVTGFILAIYGALRGQAKNPGLDEAAVKTKVFPLDDRTLAVIMTLGLVLLALGAHTPLFQLVYKVPGFGQFRGISKFAFQASLFLSLLAGIGFDHLLRTRRVGAGFVIATAAAGAVIGVIGLVVRGSSLSSMMIWMIKTRESYLSPAAVENLGFVQEATNFSSNTLLICAGTLLLLSALLACLRTYPQVVYGILALGLVEVFLFAGNSLDTFDGSAVVPPPLRNFLAERPGDYRVLNLLNPDSAMAGNFNNLSGYAPDLRRRYGEFMFSTQDANPDEATQNIPFRNVHPLYSMLRLRYVFAPDNNGMRVMDVPNPMPHVQLVGRWRVLEKRDAIFTAMKDQSFDPRQEVILEREPQPAPSAMAAGTARIVSETTDSLTIEADTPQPAILLVTDVYTPAWQAISLAGSSQAKYEVMPANYILRAVPLAAGHHHLRLEYRPRGFLLGFKISLCTLTACLGVLGWWLFTQRKEAQRDAKLESHAGKAKLRP